MLPAGKFPASNGGGASFLGSERQVCLWMRMTKMGPASRASALALRVNSVGGQGCLSSGGGQLGDNDGATRMLEILRNYFAPEAADSICQEVVRCTQYRRAGRPIDEHIVAFDSLRRKAESKM